MSEWTSSRTQWLALSLFALLGAVLYLPLNSRGTAASAIAAGWCITAAVCYTTIALSPRLEGWRSRRVWGRDVRGWAPGVAYLPWIVFINYLIWTHAYS